MCIYAIARTGKPDAHKTKIPASKWLRDSKTFHIYVSARCCMRSRCIVR